MGFLSSLLGMNSSSDLQPDQLPSLLAQHERVIWLDVRTPAEHQQGHLPHSKLMDFMAPGFAQKVQSLDPEALILVYCRSGNRSASAVSTLKAQGFKNAYNLSGGYNTWKAALNSKP